MVYSCLDYGMIELMGQGGNRKGATARGQPQGGNRGQPQGIAPTSYKPFCD